MKPPALAIAIVPPPTATATPAPAANSHAILSSESTAADGDWAKVLAALEAKYPGASKIVFPDGDPAAALTKLKKLHPRHTCVVAPHAEVTRGFVAAVHQLVTDDFILVPNPRQCDPDRDYTVVFKAAPLAD